MSDSRKIFLITEQNEIDFHSCFSHLFSNIYFASLDHISEIKSMYPFKKNSVLLKSENNELLIFDIKKSRENKTFSDHMIFKFEIETDFDQITGKEKNLLITKKLFFENQVKFEIFEKMKEDFEKIDLNGLKIKKAIPILGGFINLTTSGQLIFIRHTLDESDPIYENEKIKKRQGFNHNIIFINIEQLRGKKIENIYRWANSLNSLLIIVRDHQKISTVYVYSDIDNEGCQIYEYDEICILNENKRKNDTNINFLKIKELNYIDISNNSYFCQDIRRYLTHSGLKGGINYPFLLWWDGTCNRLNVKEISSIEEINFEFKYENLQNSPKGKIGLIFKKPSDFTLEKLQELEKTLANYYENENFYETKQSKIKSTIFRNNNFEEIINKKPLTGIMIFKKNKEASDIKNYKISKIKNYDLDQNQTFIDIYYENGLRSKISAVLNCLTQTSTYEFSSEPEKNIKIKEVLENDFQETNAYMNLDIGTKTKISFITKEQMYLRKFFQFLSERGSSLSSLEYRFGVLRKFSNKNTIARLLEFVTSPIRTQLEFKAILEEIDQILKETLKGFNKEKNDSLTGLKKLYESPANDFTKEWCMIIGITLGIYLRFELYPGIKLEKEFFSFMIGNFFIKKEKKSNLKNISKELSELRKQKLRTILDFDSNENSLK